MNYETLSPSDCAAQILDQILIKCPDQGQRLEIENLIRSKVRMLFEHCAMIAEDYVAEHDPAEYLTGEEVGDRIAECFRQLADERKRDRGAGGSVTS